MRFRVWCINKNEWEEHPILINQLGDLFHLGKGGLQPARKDTHIIQKFTGLLDKNGKEVYEGDLWLPWGLSKPYEIRWHINGYWFYRYGMEIRPIQYTDEGEVIGNIYENPELLQNKK